MIKKSAPRIYLDYNASAPCRSEVLEAQHRAMSDLWGNPSSNTREGRMAREALEDARTRIADAIGAQPGEIVFTSGGTESDNLAITGIMAAEQDSGVQAITSTIEHHAVLEPCRRLRENGVRVVFAGCLESGRVRIEEIEHALNDRTRLVSVMHVNNETGMIQPIRQIAELAHAHGALLHTDAVQSIGKIPARVDELGADLLSISAHKLGGPKGIGALYVRAGIPLRPTLLGGPQEFERRAGTENVPAAIGFAVAIERAVAEQTPESVRLASLRNRLWAGIQAGITGTHLNGDLANLTPTTLNISFDQIDAHALVSRLDEAGIAVSTGAACTVGSGKLSHVLEAMCYGRDRCRGAIRFSLGYATTSDEIETVLQILPPLVDDVRKNTQNDER